MNVAIYEGNEFNITKELRKHPDAEQKRLIEKYRKFTEKGAMTCPFCNGKLLLRAGQIREIHFAHLPGKTCLISEAYDTYQKQIKRENDKHSVIKEIVYNELKSQEKIKPDLKVEYGYREKAAERWRYYPDIYLNKNGHEFAISIITNVHEIGDNNVVTSINRRNDFFGKKGLQPIWFIEERELAEDFDHRVLHLWEAEFRLAIKTNEDRVWDTLLVELINDFPDISIFELLGYRSYGQMNVDVRSLYYVHSTVNETTFSVYRMILDEDRSPYRAFAVSKGYRVNLSDALIVRDEILLSDKNKEEKNRDEFVREVSSKILEFRERSTTNVLDSLLQESFDVIEIFKKLKSATISATEAEGLYHYLKLHRQDLDDYGVRYVDLLSGVRHALGKISDTEIRKWLVEIEYL